MATPLASSVHFLRSTVTPLPLPSRSTTQLAVSQTSTAARIGRVPTRTSANLVVANGGSSSPGSVAEEGKASASSGNEANAGGAPEVSTSQPTRAFSLTACQACGKEERVGGCNGEGRILGGLSSVPGFGWVPIKAYRPCPAFVDAGGRYKRQGQSLEEVAFGRMGKQDNLDITERLQGNKKK